MRTKNNIDKKISYSNIEIAKENKPNNVINFPVKPGTPLSQWWQKIADNSGLLSQANKYAIQMFGKPLSELSLEEYETLKQILTTSEE
jgi:hypothetical protein